MKNVTQTYFPLAIMLFLFIYVTGCAPDYTKFKVTRPAGVVLDKSVYIMVDRIEGRDNEIFKNALIKGIKSDFSLRDQLITSFESFGTTGQDSIKSGIIKISGIADNEYEVYDVEERKNSGKDEEEYYIKKYTLSFDYLIRHNLTGDTISSGRIVDTDSTKDLIVTFLVFNLTSRDQDSSHWDAKRKYIVKKFIDKIKPHVRNVEVLLFDDSEMPELKDGISCAKKKEWKDAINYFKTAIEKYPTNKNIHKAYYDIGVAYEHDYQFKEAIEYLEKACSMIPPKSTREFFLDPNAPGPMKIYREELERCKQFMHEYYWQEKRTQGLQ